MSSMEDELSLNGQQAQQQPQQPDASNYSTPVPQTNADEPRLPTKEYIQQITAVELPDSVTSQFRIYLTQDWPLGNFSKEYTHEIKWLGRSRAKEIIINHAPSNSILSPEARSEFYDLPSEDCLESLSHRQQMEIIDLGEIIYARATRGEGGMQQDQMGKTMNVNRNEQPNDQQNGGKRLGNLWGIFG